MRTTRISHIHELIETGESQHLDFKQSINDASKIAKTMSAYANGDGGVLLVGVKDNGNISGVNAEEEHYMLDLAAKVYCKPSVEIEMDIWEVEGKGVIKCTVVPGEDRPYYAKDESGKWWVYERVEDQTLLASHIKVEVMKRLSQGKGTMIQYSEAQKELFEYLSDNERITLREFQKLTRLNRWKASKILINLISAGILFAHRSEKEEYFALN